MVTVLKYMYQAIFRRGMLKHDKGLGLLNPFNIFDPSPDIAYASRLFCLFYNIILIVCLKRAI